MAHDDPRAARSLPWILGGVALAAALGAGAWSMAARGIDARSLLGAIGDRGGARPAVQVGAVTNGSGVGGDGLVSAARQGLDDALRSPSGAAPAASRGARVMARGGHVFDANVVRVERSAGRVRAEASVVVSTQSGRRYEFASTSAITLTGPVADTDEGVADSVRRAMRSAASHAVEQLAGR